MKIQICDIRITDRIRKDNGDLQALAESIKKFGQIQNIVVMESDKGYVLIAGFRRLSAMKILGSEMISASVLSPMDAEDQLLREIEENESRKQFTPSERVEYAEKIKAIEQEKARKRQSEHARDGHNKNQGEKQVRDCGPTPEKGRSRDAIAEKVGFNSGRQLERATYIAKNRPDLMEQVDAGVKSITGAYNEAKADARTLHEPQELVSMGKINGKYGHIATEFNQPDGIDFILYEISTAAGFYLDEISGAAIHYTAVMQNPENDEAIHQLLQTTFENAMAYFKDRK